MKRRSFLGILGASGFAPFVFKRTDAKSVETSYKEPFEGYNDYVERLREHIGKDVNVEANGSGITYIKKQLLGLERFDDSDNELFPHRLSFDDGSTINLRKIRSITQLEISLYDVHPENESVIYFNMLSERNLEKLQERQRESQGRYG